MEQFLIKRLRLLQCYTSKSGDFAERVKSNLNKMSPIKFELIIIKINNKFV